MLLFYVMKITKQNKLNPSLQGMFSFMLIVCLVKGQMWDVVGHYPLLLDKENGKTEIHSRWKIFCTGNFAETFLAGMAAGYRRNYTLFSCQNLARLK